MNDTTFTTHALACFGGAAACLIMMAGLGEATSPPRRFPEPVQACSSTAPISPCNPGQGVPSYTPPGMRLGLEEKLEPWSAMGSPTSVVLYGHKRDGTPVSIQVDDDGHVMCAP